MKIKIKLLIFFCLFAFYSYSQIGGSNVYEFLELPNSARVASLGGNNISLFDKDLNLVYHNPALLDSSMDNHIVLNYVNYFSDINFGYVAYAKNIKKIGTIAAGLHHVNYGKFTEADETGQTYGYFYAYDYAINISWSRKLDSLFTFGAEIKPILSKYEDYSSFGLALDAGITYYNPKRQLAVSLVVNNMGSQLKPFVKGNYEPLPFEVQVGVSKKIKHAPIRISIMGNNLNKYNLRYINTNNPPLTVDPISGDTIPEKKFANFADNIMRHSIFGVEFLPLKNMFINFGYNYQRRQELKVPTKVALIGMSWGIGIRISKFNFSYGRASYHIAGATNHFSITSNISDFYKKQ